MKAVIRRLRYFPALLRAYFTGGSIAYNLYIKGGSTAFKWGKANLILDSEFRCEPGCGECVREDAEVSDHESCDARIEELFGVLLQARGSLEWIDENWTSNKASRGSGLPMCRAALKRVVEVLEDK